ncbi:MAG: DUF4956 domain-containing protein [Flavobacteriales bacterium]|nr:DUF4956 domain-containing protein [Flavobacteriales bacterium]MBO72263.1 DUF4956 domain-containing protein [Flavobacteriales bacterium]|tara:strand:+ start:4312 stop:4914 length:603 start_codon:yes stop_codon:yes gene_type:complete
MEIFGIPLFDMEDFGKLFFKFGIDLIFLFITVRFVFYRNNRDKDYLFTFFMFNLLTFFICVLLRKVPMEMGFAMGLFAVFGILRYRTEALPIKEMTYLFIVIGLAMINALTNKSISMIELIFTDCLIVGTTFGIEAIWFNNHERSKNLIYEKINLVKPEHEEELIKDLRERTGLDIFKISVGKIDFLKDTADIKIYYKES